MTPTFPDVRPITAGCAYAYPVDYFEMKHYVDGKQITHIEQTGNQYTVSVFEGEDAIADLLLDADDVLWYEVA